MKYVSCFDFKIHDNSYSAFQLTTQHRRFRETDFDKFLSFLCYRIS